ncbi:MAG: hypothetical protein N3C62_00640 [Synergistetes bacterium]|nr:hypothetical protein [Synergistota bacterium]
MKEILILIQRNLLEALQYFLYGSYTLPDLTYILGGRFLSSESLLKLKRLFDEVRPWLPDIVSLLGNPRISEEEYAKVLSYVYGIWEEIITDVNDVNRDLEVKEIPLGLSYDSWFIKGGRSERYKAVHLLREYLLGEEVDKLFLRCLVHGSVATLDDVVGFSDLDTAFIIRASVIKDFRKLVRVRRIASQILSFTYFFDPFMHHGPYYISEVDLGFYPEAYFPLVLFENGFDLIDPIKSLKASVRPSEEITDEMLKRFEIFFKERVNNPCFIRDCYDLEWVLGNVMILPVLYLQRKTGVFRYKREALALAREDFTEIEWEPVELASLVRASFKSRPKVKEWLLRLSLMLHFPEIIRSWCRCDLESLEEVRNVLRFLGDNYIFKVLNFIEIIKSKLDLRWNV